MTMGARHRSLLEVRQHPIHRTKRVQPTFEIEQRHWPRRLKSLDPSQQPVCPSDSFVETTIDFLEAVSKFSGEFSSVAVARIGNENSARMNADHEDFPVLPWSV
jgi:hypothetical protein